MEVHLFGFPSCYLSARKTVSLFAGVLSLVWSRDWAKPRNGIGFPWDSHCVSSYLSTTAANSSDCVLPDCPCPNFLPKKQAGMLELVFLQLLPGENPWFSTSAFFFDSRLTFSCPKLFRAVLLTGSGKTICDACPATFLDSDVPQQFPPPGFCAALTRFNPDDRHNHVEKKAFLRQQGFSKSRACSS